MDTSCLTYRNLSKIKPVKICEILGYAVYAPEHIANSPFLHKQNCPYWILLDRDGTCVVYMLKKQDNVEAELTVFIRENLPFKGNA